MPLDMVEYGARGRAGLARHYRVRGAPPTCGDDAALTTVPVFGVPVPSRYLRGEDSLRLLCRCLVGAGGYVASAWPVPPMPHCSSCLLATSDAALQRGLWIYRSARPKPARNGCDAAGPDFLNTHRFLIHD